MTPTDRTREEERPVDHVIGTPSAAALPSPDP
ncbi:hypothetical protein FHS43_001907 [Streptosporangium becharense]|uniref:Uncharacterized protein n=1 Tax=Streptosporangium becharense TaxID=1816182 RepID=A0A7W9IAX8_9ACTN|nr:hypothetical protein [Streptosporangium becharense]MBB5817339.1 hypothetical protein [Streptosporangium becharense]